MPREIKRRIVITGMGAVTGFGEGVAPFWDGISQGKSAIRRFDIISPDPLSVKIAAQAPLKFPSFSEKPLTRAATLALAAAQEAFSDSGLKSGDGIALSSAIGWGTPTQEEILQIGKSRIAGDNTELQKILEDNYTQRVSTGYGQEVLCRRFRLTGPILSSLSACAASTQAIGEAAALIQSGEVDVAIAGGADSRLHILGLVGYSLLGALDKSSNDAPEKASCPFDKSHRGFVIGEGAGFLILEELEHALARSAKIHAEVLSWAATTDAYRVTDPDPEGEGAYRCMKLCISRAGVLPEDIGYVNAHGTSTPANDRAECYALQKTFGDHVRKVAISSTKSMIGHLSMAAGVVETIAAILALREGILPPTRNFSEPEPEFDFDFVPNHPRPAKIVLALKNSFGFGGQNASLLLKKFSP